MLETTEKPFNPAAATTPRAPQPPRIPFNADDEDDISPEMQAAMFGQYEE
jgi:hypothetical protein